jgi:hypothetical protein
LGILSRVSSLLPDFCYWALTGDKTLLGGLSSAEEFLESVVRTLHYYGISFSGKDYISHPDKPDKNCMVFQLQARRDHQYGNLLRLRQLPKQFQRIHAQE